MKIAVLSDVHGNLPALEAVLDDIERWGADAVVVNGDLVSRGPYSLACLRLLQRTLPEATLLQGNHEEYVLASARAPTPPDAPDYAFTRFARWSAEQLAPALAEIASWRAGLDLEDADGGSVHITHGSRLGSRDGIHPGTDDAELPAKLGDHRDLFIASHTHKPLLRRFNETLVVNVGSVGTPMDGDHRAAYGRFGFDGKRWQAEIRRVRYDLARAERDFIDSGFVEAGGPFARLILEELRRAHSLVGPWMRKHYRGVMAGELDPEAEVERTLAELGAR